jgi:hypothetical protein
VKLRVHQPQALSALGEAWEASSSRELDAPLTSLTYQSVAVFGDPDDEAESGESHLARLHDSSPEGAGVLAAQRGSDPFDVTAVIRRHWS